MSLILYGDKVSLGFGCSLLSPLAGAAIHITSFTEYYLTFVILNYYNTISLFVKS